MEREEAGGMFLVSRPRLPMRSLSSYSLALSGLVAGLGISLIIWSRTPPPTAKAITALAMAFLSVAQISFIVAEHIRLRRFQKQLKIESDGMLTMMRAEIELNHPDAPPEIINEVMKHIKETLNL
jgi:hypothetical protein